MHSTDSFPPLQALHLLGEGLHGNDDTAWYQLEANVVLIERRPPHPDGCTENEQEVVIEVVGAWDAVTAAPYTLLIG